MTEKTEVERLDPEEVFRSLNGFEEIAIEQHFRKNAGDLASDGVALMRALLFVLHKRDGMGDTDAFRTVMLMRLDEVVDRFVEDGTVIPGEA